MKAPERKAACAALREILPRGTTVYTVLRHVSASGMTRFVDLYIVDHGEILRITHSAAQATGEAYDRKQEALRMRGCGFNAPREAVARLAQALFDDARALHFRSL